MPVEVHQVAFRIASEWAVEDEAPDSTGFGVWTIRPGVDETRHFVGRFLLAPDERMAVVEGQARCDCSTASSPVFGGPGSGGR